VGGRASRVHACRKSWAQVAKACGCGRAERGHNELGASSSGKVKENHEMDPDSTNPRYNFIILVELDMIVD
jgi:hypothetical protein